MLAVKKTSCHSLQALGSAVQAYIERLSETVQPQLPLKLKRSCPCPVQALGSTVAAYVEGLSKEQVVAEAEQQVLLGKPAEALASVFLADAAAAKAQVRGV